MLAALLIGAASLWYTNKLVNKLSEEEGKLLENYAGLAMQAIIGSIEPLKSQEDYDHVSVAKDAFQFAQAMMQIRYLSKK